MLQGVNLEEVKKYNSSLKMYKDKAASLNAEIEYNNKELDSLCAELTAELGTQVTRDNVEQIYNDQVSKINSTLQSGTAVLSKIASEEQAIASGQSQANTQQASVTPQASAPQPVGSTQQTNISVAPVVPPMPPEQPSTPAEPVSGAVTGSIFNGQSSVLPGGAPNTELPTLFHM